MIDQVLTPTLTGLFTNFVQTGIGHELGWIHYMILLRIKTTEKKE